MPNVITIANPKGGVGKSTTAINLANAIKNKVKTGLIDADPQGTSIKLGKVYNNLDVFVLDATPFQELPYDYLFVDTPPYKSEHLLNIFIQSDLIIIPTKAGIAELMEIQPMLQMLKEARKANSKLQARILFNMIVAGSALTGEIQNQITSQIAEYNIQCFNTMLINRQNYTRSIANPNGIYDIADAKAEKEMMNLLNEMLLLLKK